MKTKEIFQVLYIVLALSALIGSYVYVNDRTAHVGMTWSCMFSPLHPDNCDEFHPDVTPVTTVTPVTPALTNDPRY